MTAATLVPLSEYLQTSYRPDCEWLDGEVKERNMGEGPHSLMQKFFVVFFGTREKLWGVRVLPEQRVQTSASHYRVPDVCVVRAEAALDLIVRSAPLLCVEILSHEDRMGEMLVRVDDYLAMGVPVVWLVDPWHRKLFIADRAGFRSVAELTVPDTPIRVGIDDVFAELDQLQGRS